VSGRIMNNVLIIMEINKIRITFIVGRGSFRREKGARIERWR